MVGYSIFALAFFAWATYAWGFWTACQIAVLTVVSFILTVQFWKVMDWLNNADGAATATGGAIAFWIVFIAIFFGLGGVIAGWQNKRATAK